MNKTNNIPTLRFPEFKDNWEMKKLGEITNWASGGTPPKDNDDYWNGNIPWISASSMRGTKYSDSELKITVEGLKKGSKLAKEGTLLILVRGSMLFNKIPIGIVTKDVAFNQDVKSIVVNKESTSNYILQWFLSYESKIMNMVTGTGIGAGKLDLDELKKIELSFPTLPEQTKIANFLTAVDEKIQALKKKKSLLENYKKGLMQKLFSQTLRFKDEHGNDFANWEVKKLGEVCEITIGEFVIKTKQNPNGKYPVYNGGITPTGFYDDFNNEGNKIIISARGANAGFVNFQKEKYWAGNSCYSIDVLNKSNFRILFFYYFIKMFQNRFVENQQAANIPSVSKKDAELFEINLPCLAEQTKIANFLSSIDSKIGHCQTSIVNYERWKKGLLQRLFV